MRFRFLQSALFLGIILSPIFSLAQSNSGAMQNLDNVFTANNTFTQGLFAGSTTVSNLSALIGTTNFIYTTDGLAGSIPCTGGGAGAFAFYVAGAWTCGASGISFSAPPPIGNVLPNTATFTTEFVKTQNNILFADQFPGANAGLKINAALQALPASGGIVDARGLVGAQVSSTNIFNGITTQGATVLLGAATYTLSQQWNIPNRSRVIGLGRGDATFCCTVLLASGSFPTGTPVVRMGSGTVVFGTRLENLTIDCNGVTNCTGVYSTDLNEQSGIFNLTVNNFSAVCVNIDGTAASDSGAGNFNLSNIECLSGTNGNSSTTIGVKIKTKRSSFGRITDVTSNGSAGHQQALGMYIDNTDSGVIEHIHFEQVVAGIQIGDPIGVNGVHGLFAADISCGVSYTNCVTLNDSGTRAITLNSVLNYASQNSIQDNINTITQTAYATGLYALDDQQFPYFTTPLGGLTLPLTTINGHINQSFSGQFAKTCAMSASTTCTITLLIAYSTPVCIATQQSAGTVIAGECSVSGTTVTITAASSNSATWGAIVVGNPN